LIRRCVLRWQDEKCSPAVQHLSRCESRILIYLSFSRLLTSLCVTMNKCSGARNFSDSLKKPIVVGQLCQVNDAVTALGKPSPGQGNRYARFGAPAGPHGPGGKVGVSAHGCNGGHGGVWPRHAVLGSRGRLRAAWLGSLPNIVFSPAPHARR
jgi:hypothetical protein